MRVENTALPSNAKTRPSRAGTPRKVAVMTPKTLLTVIDSAQSADDIAGAITLCRDNDCHLAVLVVGIALPASTTAYGAVPAETWSEEREKGRAEAAAKAAEIEGKLKEAGISGDVAPYFCEEGQISDIVGMRARYTDLGLVYEAADSIQQLLRREHDP